MAIIKKGILGGFSKKVGNVVGGSWKGISYMRALPESVANPRTPKQVAQRTKFSTVVALAKIILVSLIKPMWDRFAQKQSGYNAFVQANIGAIASDGVITFANLKTSVGSLKGCDTPEISASTVTTVTVDWVDNSGEGDGLGTDEAYIGIMDTDTSLFVGALSGSVVRSAATAVVSTPDGFSNFSNLKAYVSFRRPDGTKVSTSVIGDPAT